MPDEPIQMTHKATTFESCELTVNMKKWSEHIHIFKVHKSFQSARYRARQLYKLHVTRPLAGKRFIFSML